jgi:hypothetical protein
MQQFTELQKGTYEETRHNLAVQITAAKEKGDHRLTVILCRRFIDAFPNHGLVPIERHVREVFREQLRTAKQNLKSVCPVCGGPMQETACCDDLFRPYCAKCGKTYTPLGYDDEYDYALKWRATLWDGGEEPTEVITV